MRPCLIHSPSPSPPTMRPNGWLSYRRSTEQPQQRTQPIMRSLACVSTGQTKGHKCLRCSPLGLRQAGPAGNRPIGLLRTAARPEHFSS
ncbi:hypothetical protein SORBI_3005G137500 [Sorghum bicolor]|uniref:Uncharacterized protein n=1 Tax=Sorghum bicolor TaxID=4558 RepID=A0A1B6PSB1_SORBI|nr:hypothetical protein SORBI_3005G137500 [Sorghum bicolor]